MNRRDLLFGTAAAVLANAAMPSAAHAADESAATVQAITNAQRRLDGTTASAELAGPVRAHLRMATHLRTGIWDPTSGQAMTAALSEIAGFAAWLHWDMHDLGTARRHYRLAVEHAAQAHDPLLSSYMLGSLASFVVHEGDPGEGLALIRHATKASATQRPATADAWLAATEAVAHASAGHDTDTWHALDRAQAAVERAAAEEHPPWPWVFRFDTRKLATHRLTCAVRLRHPDAAQAAAEHLTHTPPLHRKQGALVLFDLATAHTHTQELDEALRVATAAIDLAAPTGSERALHRARQFRRALPAHAPHRLLHDFDEHLRAANTPDQTLT